MAPQQPSKIPSILGFEAHVVIGSEAASSQAGTKQPRHPADEAGSGGEAHSSCLQQVAQQRRITVAAEVAVGLAVMVSSAVEAAESLAVRPHASSLGPSAWAAQKCYTHFCLLLHSFGLRSRTQLFYASRAGHAAMLR